LEKSNLRAPERGPWQRAVERVIGIGWQTVKTNVGAMAAQLDWPFRRSAANPPYLLQLHRNA
jgi:hypothetical protein